ncbi:MAG: hypothetical protein V4732_04780 [Pseudomonadota bacterium]
MYYLDFSTSNKNKRYQYLFYIYISVLFIFLCENAQAEFIISLRSPEAINDQRESYNSELIALALEKTKSEYGNYTIHNIPPMNTARSIFSLETDVYKNLLVELSYEEELERDKNLTYINFPIHLGIVGYRICFANPRIHESLKSIQSVGDLKKFSIGQGLSWADTKVLRHNGFHVIEIGNYESLFKMTIAGRIDLFCRGANELFNEYLSHKYMGDLHYDQSFAIRYTLPRFYYLNKKNVLAKERIEKGLIAAYKDGSLQKIWLKHFLSGVELANLKKRKIFTIENPLIKSLPKDYNQYFYDPLKN